MHKDTIAFFSQFGVTVGLLDIASSFSATIGVTDATAETIHEAICDADGNIDPISIADLAGDGLTHITVLNPIVMARGPNGQGILQPILPMVDIKQEQRPAVFPIANLVFISARDVAAPYFEATSSISLSGIAGFAKA